MDERAAEDGARESHPLRFRTVFLDRDGVINRKPAAGEYVADWAEFALLPGVPQAIVRMNAAGLRVFVVTNQRGIARGLVQESAVREIHRRMVEVLAALGARIDGVYVCPHDEGECDCRKPAPGLFRQAQRDVPGVDFAESVVVGDSWTDMEAGNAIGAATIRIEPDSEAARATSETARVGLRVDAVVGSLAEAAEWILRLRDA
ncbi:MAG: HAD family hydrolase [Candidatus Bipolaricaulis sp.]|nr:HAD family hydrolase [Candidatus Bipolaricaulis sp.]